MTLPLLDIPDDPATWPTWLEGQIVGAELGELVDELAAVLETMTAGPSLDDICGSQLSGVLERGLSTLTAEQIRLLLKHPSRLLELQERILIDGGPYWVTKLDTPTSRDATARQWEKLTPRLVTTTAATHTVPSRRRIGMIIGTLAAGLLIGIGFGLWRTPSWQPWGPDVLTAKLDADPFLEHLADHAEEFQNQPRGSATELEQQITAFRRSCDALLAAPLPQLDADDRTWLNDRCRVWAAKFDSQLAALRDGTKPWQDMREEADATVRTLAKALRDRLVS